MNIKRGLKKKLLAAIGSKKVLILYGARQVGKTTLVKDLLKETRDSAYLSCDEPDVRAAFTEKTSTEMLAFIRGAKTIVLDEAQRIPGIGLTLKTLHDAHPEITIIATGSSSFELANGATEPLTGRNVPFTLYPVSYAEYAKTVGERDSIRLLGERLCFGMYPAVITSKNPKQEIYQIAQDYLFKDVLRVERIRKPIVVEKLTQLLAHQTGQLVSYNEIAQKLEVSRPTVMNYVRILEQAFIIFRVSPLGKNKRNEITRFEKIYFYDVGIRNALINSFDLPENRSDIGCLFENFFIAERLKQYQQEHRVVKQYFWQNKTGSEIDLIEESHEKMEAFECKWRNTKIHTRAWQRSFPAIPVTLINKENVWQYIGLAT